MKKISRETTRYFGSLQTWHRFFGGGSPRAAQISPVVEDALLPARLDSVVDDSLPPARPDSVVDDSLPPARPDSVVDDSLLSTRLDSALDAPFQSIQRVEKEGVQGKMAQYQLLRHIANNQVPKTYGILLEKTPNQWLILENGEYRRPMGRYAFVRMLNGDIRVWRIKRNLTFHGALSGGADSVRYAGEIDFDNSLWNNQCSTYAPSESLLRQAGLPVENFADYRNPFFNMITDDSMQLLEEASSDITRIDGFVFRPLASAVNDIMAAWSEHHINSSMTP